MIASLMLDEQRRLPVPPTRLIGREQERDEIADLLGRSGVRLVTLTGPGGVGKTHLSLAAAERALPAFAGDALFVALESVTDDRLVLPTIANALGFQREAETNLVEALGEAMSDRRVLLVLDNLEQVIGAGPEIGRLLARSAELTILATSRSPLRIRAEHEIPVAPLSLPDHREALDVGAFAGSDAVSLFVERARQVRPGFTLTDDIAPVVAEICRVVDGLPLAIELAAAQLRLLSPQALLARMTRRLQVLTNGAVDLPARQRSLSDAIAWSYDLLQEDARRAFHWLSVFAGGFTLDAAEAVLPASSDPDGVLSVVGDLVDASLLTRVEPTAGCADVRFRMLATIEEFAGQRLDASGEARDASERHLEWFLALAERGNAELIGPDQARWVGALAADIDNFRKALEVAHVADPARGVRLASALWRFWSIRGYLREGAEWLGRFLEQVDDLAAHLVAPALIAAGNLSLDLGEYGDALGAFSRALGIAEMLGDQRLVANALNGLGMVAWYRGEMSEARSRHERSLAIRRAIGDRHGEANSYSNLGNVLKDGGDTANARELHLQALKIRNEMGNVGAAGYSSLNLGDVARRTGDPVAARSYFEQSLAAFRQVDDTLGTAYALQGLGLAAQLAGESREASGWFGESLLIRQQHGDRRGVVECIEGIASAAASVSGHADAARLFGAASALRDAFQAHLPDPDRSLYDRSLSAARRALDPDALEAAWSAGASMSLPEAAAEGASIAQAIATVHDAPAGLSPREIEVLRLIAGGLTNAATADRLYLSRRTVDAHLRRIYDKIGTSSRADVVRFAREQRIL